MLTEICQYLRNWFERKKIYGWFKIANGILIAADGTALPLLSGQYFRLIGSVLNDGVHKAGDAGDTLTDEPAFAGAVWTMAVPPDFLTLVGEIGNWISANANALNSPYQSESFGGYSYTLRSGTDTSGQSTGVSWESQFASRLAPWRKI